MKTKLFLTLFIISVVVTTSCKKDAATQTQLTQTQLSNVVEGASTISTKIQSVMLSTLAAAADSGFSTGSVPSLEAKKFAGASLKSTADFNWIGPDAQGWYYRRYTSLGYDYSEKVRLRDTIDYVLTINANNDGDTYSSTTTTQYIKYTKNKKVLYKGFSDWQIKTFGNNSISSLEWKIVFSDWDPATGAGIYDWYWGVSVNSGGDTVPYHRYLNMIATTDGMQPSWIDVKVTFYDEGGMEIWKFEYATTWVPVEMPETPEP